MTDKGGILKVSAIRGLIALGVFVIVGIGLALHTGTGTLSSMGVGIVASICPLGALESFFGTWAFVPRALIALVAVTIIVVIVGKAFCAWACPVPHIQNLFKTKKRRQIEEQARRESSLLALSSYQAESHIPTKPTFDTRYVVMGGALLSTAIFGFPVFCLVCPVGLSFATFILLWRFVQFNEITGGLLIFPAVLLIEVVLLRTWCMKLCPLGALLSLVSRFNKTWRPSVDTSACLRNKDEVPCATCSAVCPEYADPHSDLGERSMVECVKCHNCADSCPAHAITFPFFKPKAKAETTRETDLSETICKKTGR